MENTQASLLTGAEGIVECLKIEEISKVFCVPGESYLPLLDGIYDEPEIDLYSARHEGGASFMAEGYAKASGKPGVVMATRGVGASNLSIGVHTAYQDSTPMVVFIGQVSREVREREGFQEVNLQEMFRYTAKWAVELNEAKRVPELVQRAFRVAQTGRPGPVIVSLPEDMLKEKAVMNFGPKIIMPKPKPADSEIQEIEKLLKGAERPLIIAGGGVKAARAEDDLLSFVEHSGIPVLTAFRRHDVFPHHHKRFMGHLGLGTHPEIKKTVQEADVLLVLGSRLSEVTTQNYQFPQFHQRLIHIDIDADTIGKVFAPDIGVVADAKEALKGLQAIKGSEEWKDWSDQRRKAYEQAANIHASEDSSIYQQVYTSLIEDLPQGAIISNDAGNFAGWLHAYYPFRQKNTYIGPTSGAMGYGMPAALGAKLAHPNRPVISLSGDGGFMMTMQELETAVRYRIPVIALVFNNQSYGTIRMHQEIHHPGRVMGTSLSDAGFARYAESMGAIGIEVKEGAEFKAALSKALSREKPVVMDIKCDAEQVSVGKTIQQIREQSIIYNK
ncbi:acetolactate synthase [Virgibacillus sp. MSP4-1]|uniref:thiamine pyrophosphate-dependent enzyme n=1 Tax=Virgibacillus sp. MSP4-1 TaxID=2700081 RepID=UPI0003AB171E|nr:thiamine pyrophosphate-dependent enzyme [Virgibacillus sp. MSP4-1]QHS23621.1 acetolactate synthase [Virgibacillus sp. MSP4-1]